MDVSVPKLEYTHTSKNLTDNNLSDERKSIKKLFADFDGEYIPIKIDWGTPCGNEIF